MERRQINPTGTGWAHGHEVAGASRVLFVSGQVPEDESGSVPPDFRSQCKLAWHNVERQLRDADMTLQNLVKMTIFLSDRAYIPEAYDVRKEVLVGIDPAPAMTIIIAGIYDPAWLLEIEVIAVA